MATAMTVEQIRCGIVCVVFALSGPACGEGAVTEGPPAAAATTPQPPASPPAEPVVEKDAEPPGPPAADPGRLELEGNAVQGGLLFGRVEPGSAVRIERKKIRVGKDGHFLIPLRRKARAQATIYVTFPDGAVLEKPIEIGQRTFEKDVIEGLPEEMVDPSKETRKELRASRAKIEKLRRRFREAADYEVGFVWPTQGRITGEYGVPRVLNGKKSGVHWGIDIAAPVGHKVRAPSAGVVVFAEKGVPLAGTTVIIDHGHRLTSSFLHLSKIDVKPGDVVQQGDVIGRVGRTGRATGAHLDWRMNVGKTRIDPALLVPSPDEDGSGT